jgi:hypothetical protein
MRVTLTIFVLLFAAAPAGAAERGLRLGFFDGVFASGERGPWLDRALQSGARVTKIDIGWVAAREPARPRDPADRAYDWSRADAAVAAAAARGQKILLSFCCAPAWAESPGRPARYRAGTWKPDVAAVGAYGEALGRHFAGQPAVEGFQLWNEPNLEIYLAPQWVRRNGRWRPFAPGHYRRMLNAFHAGLKRGNPRALVVTGGTAPYGDPLPGGRRTMPVRFWRELSRRPARFDVLAHHPYGVGSPRRRALNRDDAAVPDVGKLRRFARGKRMWVTEMSWDSSPPDPEGVPAARHAAWVSDAFFVLWKQGVDTITWFQIRDAAPQPSYAATNQSGVYLRDGTPKLAQQAFAFPFSCERAGRRLRVWGLAPAAGDVRIEAGGRVVATLRAGANRVFTARIARVKAPRARFSGRTSLPCRRAG